MQIKQLEDEVVSRDWVVKELEKALAQLGAPRLQPVVVGAKRQKATTDGATTPREATNLAKMLVASKTAAAEAHRRYTELEQREQRQATEICRLEAALQVSSRR